MKHAKVLIVAALVLLGATGAGFVHWADTARAIAADGSDAGGEGSILGSVIGALTITILYMGGQQMSWPKWVQEMVIGGIIIGAVAVDQIRHRRTA